MSLADELEKLNGLKANGAITEEEFQDAKRKLLRQDAPATPSPAGAVDEKMWAMFIHLGLLCGFIVPGLGLVVPIVLWQMKKDQSAFIDANGKIVANWIISALIMAAVGGLLVRVGLGLILLWALVIANAIFAIIGAVKANGGEAWPYPISFKFIQ